MPTVYLDHAATTPMHPVAVEAMTAHLRDVGNPSSLHASGRHARRVVEESRETIAQALNCRPGEVVFTAGGTEADNLALKGIYWARRAGDDQRRRILTTAVEHHAVLDPLDWLAESEGAELELLPVDHDGRLDVEALRAAVERDPASVGLISVMWANNEVGTLQPVDEVVALAAPHGIPVHTDAVQAIGAVPVDFAGVASMRWPCRDTRWAGRSAWALSPYAESSRSPRSCTVAARSATSAAAPSTPRRSPASRQRSSCRSSSSPSTPRG